MNFGKCMQVLHTIKITDFLDKDESFNNCVTNHIKNLDL